MFEKRVAIIGAGTSGLVSAVNMYKVGIQPIVFEKSSDIGGMWNSSLRPCWKTMRTNISKFSTALSDFTWPANIPLFPNQEQVYQYLKDYVEQLLPNDVFRFNTKVINVDYSNNMWSIDYHAKPDKIASEKFDFVIVASGFFDQPHIPSNISNLTSFKGQILHSSEYRSIEQVRDRNVIIVGASMSAGEIAADIAISAKNIIHIASHSFWVIPRFIPLMSSEATTPFLPIDFVFYRQSKRKSNNEILFRTNEDYKILNESFRKLTGCKQESWNATNFNDEQPPFVAISDKYAEWARAGKITLKYGRLTEIDENGTWGIIINDPICEYLDWINILLLNTNNTIETTPNDILILCTGYRPSLDFLSKSILEQLSYRSEDLFCPLILHRNIFHPNLPNLAFIGMYRGSFWAVIELQSRWVASIFSGQLSIPSMSVQQKGIEIERNIRDQQPRPQYPHGDYVGLTLDLAQEVVGPTLHSDDIVIPAQYRPGGCNKLVIDEMNSICEQANNGRFIAGAVFRSLYQSRWKFNRTLSGKPADGTAQGFAQFHYNQTQELFYKEEGKLYLSSENTLDITQKYIYGYDENTDVLTVYFVDHEKQRGSLFLTLSFQLSDSGWKAHGEHLCGQDHYYADYLFKFNGVDLIQFEITYTVKGPHKDYISKTLFQPDM